MSNVEKCARCGRSPANVWSVNELFCENCAERFGTCYMCQHRNECAFETDTDPMPKIINKTVSQMGGRMITTTQIMNPERVEKFCKVCQCNSEIDNQLICIKQLFGTCSNYKEIDFKEKTE